MKAPALFALGLLTASLHAEVVFSGLDLDTRSQLLFSARNVTPSADYSVWFQADLSSGAPPEPLTLFPERATYLPALGQLQVHNRFGVWRINADTGAVVSVSPVVFGQDPGQGEGRSLPLAFSPDGRLVLRLKPETAVTGTLELRDVTTGAATVVATGVGLSRQDLAVLWSPDSQFFVYEKNDGLYYYSLKQLQEKRVPEENLRWIGPGLIASASWGGSGELDYVSDQVLYRILPEEFFTRSLYRAQFQTWGVLGKLPFPFQPASDRFWLAPDGKSVLFELAGRTLFVYPLEYLDYYQTAKLSPLTYLPLPQSLTLKKVVWTHDNRITLLASALKSGKEETQLLRLAATSVQTLDPGPGVVLDVAPSPDETQVLIVKTDGLSVRDAATFAERRAVPLDGLTGAFWRDGSTLLAAGRNLVSVAVGDGTVKVLALGRLDEAGHVSGQLAGRQGNAWFVRQAATATAPASWKPSAAVTLDPPSTANESYRAFASDLPSGPYRNTILVRNLKALTTKPLIPQPEKAYEAFPAADVTADTGDGVTAPFRHGSRLRLREVAFAIDALDSSDGLPEVLRALNTWGFKATFFVNGEFLRRNPQAAQEIAQSGMETASLFHIPLDLTAPGFVIDADFVRRGLARQEDDWFAVTGTELGLLWHAPGWVESPAVLEGARAANYKTVGTDLYYPLAPGKAVDVPALITSLLKNKKPGSIVPLTLGMKDSTTGESLFNRWDLLLGGLAEAGYRGVTVSQLMDHSRS
jgi:peptidoglycan/xylan/chitin deacetylase (PgdA/CDA1 family)